MPDWHGPGVELFKVRCLGVWASGVIGIGLSG